MALGLHVVPLRRELGGGLRVRRRHGREDRLHLLAYLRNAHAGQLPAHTAARTARTADDSAREHIPSTDLL